MVKIYKVAFKANVTIFLCLLSSYVYAAGYQLLEQDIADLGRAYAGGAITGENAVIEFDNPGAMVQLKVPAISVSTALILAHTHFSATAINAASQSLGSGSENPLNDLKMTAAFHYVQPINDKFTFGFGITEPFGSSAIYESQGIARYFSTKTSLKTFNFNPSLAYAITNNFSIGAGVSAQYLTSITDSKYDTSLVTGSPDAKYDLDLQNTMSDWGYGFNFGLEYNFTSATEMGLSFRSAIRHRPSGDFRVGYPSSLTAAQIAYLKSKGLKDGDVSTNADLPETCLLSILQKINSNWTAMGTVAYTHWSRFDIVTLHYNTGLDPIVVPEKFHDSWRFALGADYRINNKWLVRFGTAYDGSPEDDANRRITLSDANRTWLACGTNYTFSRDLSLDVTYAHIFLDTANVHQHGTGTGAARTIDAHYNNTYANLAGVQLNWKFN